MNFYKKITIIGSIILVLVIIASFIGGSATTEQPQVPQQNGRYNF